MEHSAKIQKHFLLHRFYVKSMLVITKTLLWFNSKFIDIDFTWNMNGRKILKFLHCVEMYPKRIHLEEEKMFFLLPWRVWWIEILYPNKSTFWKTSWDTSGCKGPRYISMCTLQKTIRHYDLTKQSKPHFVEVIRQFFIAFFLWGSLCVYL